MSDPETGHSGGRRERVLKPDPAHKPAGVDPEIPSLDQATQEEIPSPAMDQQNQARFPNLPGNESYRTQTVRSLQRQVGNRAIQRILQKADQRAQEQGGTQAIDVTDLFSGPIQRDDGESVATPTAEETADLQAFVDLGPYPAAAEGLVINPPTGGSFSARYDPTTMDLTITVNIAFTFENGMDIDDTAGTVSPRDTSFDGSAQRLNTMLAGLAPDQKTQALEAIRTQWQWQGADDPEITNFMSRYRTNVTTAWSSSTTGIVFRGSRPGWEEQLANVQVEVNTEQATSTAAGGPPPLTEHQPLHSTARIYKTPQENTDFGAAVEGATATAPQNLLLGSGQAYTESTMSFSVRFDPDSSILTDSAERYLNRFIISFQAAPGSPGPNISIYGRASATGQRTAGGRRRNEQLARERAQAVADYLRTAVVEGQNLANANTRLNHTVGMGAAGATEDPSFCRADIEAEGAMSQNTPAHEFGHMIGLGDEYASTPARDAAGHIQVDADGNAISRGVISGTGGDVGDFAEHNQLGQDMGVGGAVFENNDNIMSLGNTIKPQHYATFMYALREVTGVQEWQVRG